jgi:hypothetical protein
VEKSSSLEIAAITGFDCQKPLGGSEMKKIRAHPHHPGHRRSIAPGGLEVSNEKCPDIREESYFQGFFAA